MRAPAMHAAAAALTVAALLATGCGKETRHDVKLSIQQLSSIASEGAIMAHDVSRDRSKTTYVRVHGEELSAQAQHEAEKLNDAPVAAGVKPKVEQAIQLSSEIGGAIDDMRTSPQDRAGARRVEQQLRHWADEASNLADTL